MFLKSSPDTSLFAVTLNLNLSVELFDTSALIEFIGIVELDIAGYIKSYDVPVI